MIDVAEEREDRRQEVRVIFKTTAKLIFDNKKFDDCETQDVSVNGAFVLGIKGPKVGDKCSVVLILSGKSSNLELKMEGEVIRKERKGVALQFYDVPQDSFCHLKNIVYYNYKHPEEIEALEKASKRTYSTRKPKPCDISFQSINDDELYLSNDDFGDDDDPLEEIASKNVDLIGDD